MATKKQTTAALIRAYKKEHPMAQPADIAKASGVKIMRVYGVNNYDKNASAKSQLKKQKNKALEDKIYALTQGRQRIHPLTGKILMQAPSTVKKPKADNVNHPAHYKVGGIETIDFIEAKGLSYNLGNVVKYITRADHKGNREEDLAKARWYLNREIAKLFAKGDSK